MPDSELLQIAAIDAIANIEDRANAFLRLRDLVLAKSGIVTTSLKDLALPSVTIPLTYAVAYPAASMVNSISQSAPESIFEGFNYLTLVLSNWIVQWGGWFMLSITLGLSIVIWSLPRWTGRFRLIADNWPQ